MYPHQGTNLMQFLLWIALLVCRIASDVPCKSTCVVSVLRLALAKAENCYYSISKGSANVVD
uniref:Uncharacterized protein n=1 Tax=Setaria viridis TaxID=4556 RepID=A0A4U6VCL7_SETVI|nr:hypothetical protein SEVIR_3G188301v2 [Setaria viridis]